MNRREFMQCAALLVSGAAISQVGFALTGEQKHFLAMANYNTRSVSYFTEAQRRAVAAIAETILPTTETPGAISAGVPQFIELMVADWLNDGERKIFNNGLQALMSSTVQQYGRPFEALDANTQTAILEKLESEASDSSWYELGNIQRQFLSDAPFFCQIKELTIWGFFTSEVGSTQVLRFDAMPMKFDGNQPLDPNDSSWAFRVV